MLYISTSSGRQQHQNNRRHRRQAKKKTINKAICTFQRFPTPSDEQMSKAAAHFFLLLSFSPGTILFAIVYFVVRFKCESLNIFNMGVVRFGTHLFNTNALCAMSLLHLMASLNISPVVRTANAANAMFTVFRPF